MPTSQKLLAVLDKLAAKPSVVNHFFDDHQNPVTSDSHALRASGRATREPQSAVLDTARNFRFLAIA